MFLKVRKVVESFLVSPVGLQPTVMFVVLSSMDYFRLVDMELELSFSYHEFWSLF